MMKMGHKLVLIGSINIGRLEGQKHTARTVVGHMEKRQRNEREARELKWQDGHIPTLMAHHRPVDGFGPSIWWSAGPGFPFDCQKLTAGL